VKGIILDKNGEVERIKSSQKTFDFLPEEVKKDLVDSFSS